MAIPSVPGSEADSSECWSRSLDFSGCCAQNFRPLSLERKQYFYKTRKSCHGRGFFSVDEKFFCHRWDTSYIKRRKERHDQKHVRNIYWNDFLLHSRENLSLEKKSAGSRVQTLKKCVRKKYSWFNRIFAWIDPGKKKEEKKQKKTTLTVIIKISSVLGSEAERSGCRDCTFKFARFNDQSNDWNTRNFRPLSLEQPVCLCVACDHGSPFRSFFFSAHLKRV